MLGSASRSDHAYLRGTSGQAVFDAMNHRLSAMRIDGSAGFACPQFSKLKLVDAELSQPEEDVKLRLGNDAAWTKLRGWNGYISEVVIFPQALSSDLLRAAEEELAHHFAITLRH